MRTYIHRNKWAHVRCWEATPDHRSLDWQPFPPSKAGKPLYLPLPC